LEGITEDHLKQAIEGSRGKTNGQD